MSSAAVGPPGADGWPLPLWVAHRGAGKLAPENTLAAFRLGASFGYRAFECDVKLSADGLPFLLHDAELDRTTDATGLAARLPWSALSRLDAGGWHSAAHAGEPPASLDAVARYVQANGFAVDLEIKPTPGTDHATGVAIGAACLRLWQRPASAPPPVFSSFSTEALAGARQAAPQIRRALLVDRFFTGWWEAAAALGCAAVITNHRIADAALADRLHAAGMRLLCYTVNHDDDVRRVLALGADGVITDAVDRHPPR